MFLLKKLHRTFHIILKEEIEWKFKYDQSSSGVRSSFLQKIDSFIQKSPENCKRTSHRPSLNTQLVLHSKASLESSSTVVGSGNLREIAESCRCRTCTRKSTQTKSPHISHTHSFVLQRQKTAVNRLGDIIR